MKRTPFRIARQRGVAIITALLLTTLAVTIVASDPVGSEPSGNPGQFTISRSGSPAATLQVNFAVSGTAQPGADYLALISPVTIPAGSNSVALTVTVVDELLPEGDETVVVALTAGTDYVTTSGTLLFAPGVSSQFIAVSLLDARIAIAALPSATAR